MKYLDRYLEDVKHYLYDKDKNDIIKELKSDIQNKLRDGYTEKELVEVLEELGSPIEVATSYNFENKGFSITNQNFNNYVKLIKLMFIVCLIASAVASFDIFIDYSRFKFLIDIESVVAFTISLIFNTLTFTVFSIGLLTIIFYLIEKYDTSGEYSKHIFSAINPKSNVDKNWTVKQLKAKRFNLIDYICGSLATIFWSGVFIVFLNNQFLPLEYQFFHIEYLSVFTLLIIISVVIELAVFSYRFFVGEHTFTFVVLNILKNCYGILASAYILLYKKMFYMPEIVTQISNDIFYFIFFISVIIAIASIVASIYRYIKLK